MDKVLKHKSHSLSKKENTRTVVNVRNATIPSNSRHEQAFNFDLVDGTFFDQGSA